ncbi:unnamed protein product, partial [Mycena citricolor]
MYQQSGYMKGLTSADSVGCACGGLQRVAVLWSAAEMSHASHWSAADSSGVPQTCLECRQRPRRSAAVCCGVCGTLFWSA